MADTSTTPATPKSKKPVASVAAPAFEMPKFEMPKFEMPKFEMPKFDMPSMEMPAAFRELAEKGIAQAKENYEKVKGAAEQATEMLEETYSTASKGCTDYNLKLIDAARANTNATFDLFSELADCQVVRRGGRKDQRLHAVAIRGLDRADQGIGRTRAEGRQRDVRAVKEGFGAFGKAS